MADQPQESVQHPIPDRRNPQNQQSKYPGVDRRKPLAEMQGRERDKEHDKDKGYN